MVCLTTQEQALVEASLQEIEFSLNRLRENQQIRINHHVTLDLPPVFNSAEVRQCTLNLKR